MEPKAKVAIIVFVVLICIGIPLALLSTLKPDDDVPVRSDGRGNNGARSRRRIRGASGGGSGGHVAPGNRVISTPGVPLHIPSRYRSTSAPEIVQVLPPGAFPVLPFTWGNTSAPADVSCYDHYGTIYFTTTSRPENEVVPAGKRKVVSPEELAASYSEPFVTSLDKPVIVKHTFSLLFKGLNKFPQVLDRFSGNLALVVTTAEVRALSNWNLLNAAVERGTILVLQLVSSEWRSFMYTSDLNRLIDTATTYGIPYTFRYIIAPADADRDAYIPSIDRQPKILYETSPLELSSKIETLKGAVVVDLVNEDVDEVISYIDAQIESSGIKEKILNNFNAEWEDVNGDITNFRRSLERIRSINSTFEMFKLEVSRDNVMRDSFKIFSHPYFRELVKRRQLKINFKGEPGIDAGGLKREWFSAVTRQLFDPQNGLFLASAVDQSVYYPNPLSFKKADHLQMFEAAGLFIAMAMLEGIMLNLHISRTLYKYLLEIPPDLHDLEEIDKEVYKQMIGIASEGGTTGLEDFTFETTIVDEGKAPETQYLKPNGNEIQLNEDNKDEFIALMANYKMIYEVHEQLKAFKKGFNVLIPPEVVVGQVEANTLDVLIAGAGEINVEDWKRNTRYMGGYNANSQQIIWFWDLVERLTDAERRQVLRLATGTSGVPAEGFAGLKPQTFGIQRTTETSKWPAGHTCFNYVDIPAYASQDIFDSRLRDAIREENMAFGTA